MFGFYSFAGAAINERPVDIYNESASDLISSLSDSVQNISSISVSFSDTMVLSDIGIVYRYGDWEVIQTPTSVWTPVSVGVSNVWTSIPSVS